MPLRPRFPKATRAEKEGDRAQSEIIAAIAENSRKAPLPLPLYGYVAIAVRCLPVRMGSTANRERYCLGKPETKKCEESKA